jgi:hypothetical protein
MAEIAATFALIACTGTAVFAGVEYGTRFINEKLGYSDADVSEEQPIVRPLPPPNDEIARAQF